MVRAKARSASATCRLATPTSRRSAGRPGIELVAQPINMRTTIAAALGIICAPFGLTRKDSMMHRSKVTGFGGGGLPVVMAAVGVLDRRLREFQGSRAGTGRVFRGHCLLAPSRQPRKIKRAPDPSERPRNG